MKDIPSYPNFAITVDGRVWSKPRTRLNPNSKTAIDKIGGRFLNPVFMSGYPAVRLNNGKHKTDGHWFRVHRLIAEAFIPNPTNKPHINHKNGIRNDNRIENLEWCTPKENVQHAYRTGLAKGQKGTRNGNSKLTELDVLLIRAMIELGERKSDIADWFGIERYYVHRIKNRTNWKHI